MCRRLTRGRQPHDVCHRCLGRGEPAVPDGAGAQRDRIDGTTIALVVGTLGRLLDADVAGNRRERGGHPQHARESLPGHEGSRRIDAVRLNGDLVLGSLNGGGMLGEAELDTRVFDRTRPAARSGERRLGHAEHRLHRLLGGHEVVG